MLRKKECVAMLLAGGQGSRLYALTSNIAKPAVSFGAKYRIIDFPLSNCINSGIDTVGVLTQYQPLVLNEYVGNGQPWDLDRTFGGVHILSPYEAKTDTSWYKGTANAIYQNIRFMKMYDPEYVLILSGDHIYKMDYDKMLAAHKAAKADCTIACMQVPLKEASEYSIRKRMGRFTSLKKNLQIPKAIWRQWEFTYSPRQNSSNTLNLTIRTLIRRKISERTFCLLCLTRVKKCIHTVSKAIGKT